MSIKIVADTNALVGKNTFDTLFGNRTELEKILAIPGSELVVPSIVIDELLNQKSTAFKTAKSRLTESSYYKKRVSSKVKAEIESDDTDLSSLRSDVSMPHTTIDLSDKATALDKIRRLATNYQAPFQVYSSDKKENSDKGFKDAYIALTIDEYLTQISDGENIFLLTKDARLAEYFQGNTRVVRVQSYDEINSQIEQPAKPENLVATNLPTGSVKPLSQERLNIQELLTDFRNTGTFTTTHALVPKIVKLQKNNKLIASDYTDILEATAENNQINWLLGDEDVREFILPIFKEYAGRLNTEQYNTIASGLGLETRKVQPFDNEYDEMEAAADMWIELQSDIARGK
jgi:hypothetical protein